jgi:NitT/TauT family transport system ATP-binding protein
MSIIEFSGAQFAYPASNEVFRDLDLVIADKSYVCVVGQSGSGKTTLLRLIAGLERPGYGEVTVGGNDAREAAAQIVFQDYSRSLLPWISNQGNVSLAIRMLKPAERRARSRDLLRTLGLADVADRLPRELSGGMQQRVAIARALGADPDILLLDEPFGAVDTPTKLELQEEVLRIWQEKQLTIVHVTHDLEEACFLSDRIMLIKGSNKILEIENPLPRSRQRLATREDPRFLALRRTLFEELGYA